MGQIEDSLFALDHVPVGAFLIRSSYEVAFWNRTLEAWTGIPRSEILAHSIHTFYPNLAAKVYSLRLEEIFRGGPPAIFTAPLHRTLIPAPLPEGPFRVLHTTVRAMPLPDEDGFGALFVLEDVSDLTRRVEETAQQARDLERARNEALESSRIKSEFLTNISHEIRTPLNGVLGMTELLLASPLDPQQADHARLIQLSGEALLQQINDLLDFARVESGELSLDNAPFRLRFAVQAVADVLSTAARQKGLQLRVDHDAATPEWVCGDASRLRQIMVNLVTNAIKFTEEGHVRLSVQVESESERRVLLRFVVSDTGPGIPEEQHRSIFDSFTQVDASLTRRHGGVGLGLSIAKRLTDLMGGTIGVASAPGEGATFWFRIPFETVAERPQSGSPGASAGAESQREREERPLVLVVDDSPVNQRVLTTLLRRLGCEVMVATNGAEAVDAWKARSFSLVFMDCQMPVMDGYEATGQIRQHEAEGCHTPIVAVTAQAMSGDKERCLAAGMDDYLTKPIQANDLALMLEKWGQLEASSA